VSREDALGILTEHLFPMVQKMMVNSEEQVQAEGVDALCKIANEALQSDEAKELIFEIVQLVMEDAENNEGAKIAAMMIVERFADLNLFGE
jgi:ribosomal protein L22